MRGYPTTWEVIVAGFEMSQKGERLVTNDGTTESEGGEEKKGDLSS
jgi:hypothetical protein